MIFCMNFRFIKKQKNLIITNTTRILVQLNGPAIYEPGKKINTDYILYSNPNFDDIQILKQLNGIKKYFVAFNTKYSSLEINEYKLFLNKLKLNDKNDNDIPHIKYSFISCYIESYMEGAGLNSSYNMALQISNIISTIAMSLKLIEKHGTLLLEWSIVNINIPIIKKIISILEYGFKNVEIIDNDINMNLLISIPEYNIKCSGYKDNISLEIINKLLDISFDIENYTYDICYYL